MCHASAEPSIMAVGISWVPNCNYANICWHMLTCRGGRRLNMSEKVTQKNLGRDYVFDDIRRVFVSATFALIPGAFLYFKVCLSSWDTGTASDTVKQQKRKDRHWHVGSHRCFWYLSMLRFAEIRWAILVCHELFGWEWIQIAQIGSNWIAFHHIPSK